MIVPRPIMIWRDPERLGLWAMLQSRKEAFPMQSPSVYLPGDFNDSATLAGEVWELVIRDAVRSRRVLEGDVATFRHYDDLFSLLVGRLQSILKGVGA